MAETYQGSNEPIRLRAPIGAQSVGPSTATTAVVPHAIPQQAPSGSPPGLLEAFGSFMGTLQNVADQIGNAYWKDEQRKILEEKRAAQEAQAKYEAGLERDRAIGRAQWEKRQQAAGAVDAASGKEADPALAEDYAYTTAYTQSKAAIQAGNLAYEFSKKLSEVPFGTDPAAFRDKFLQDVLASGNGAIGTGDPIYDEKLLSDFHEATNAAVKNARVSQAKALVADGKASFKAEVGARLPSLTQTDVADLVVRAQRLNPGEPETAAADVIHALVTAAGNDPARQAKALSLVRGTEFAAKFPEASLELEDKLTGAWQNGRSWEAARGLSELDRLISLTKDPADLLDIAAPGGSLDSLVSRYGDLGGQPETLRRRALSRIKEEAQQSTKLAQFGEMLNGLRTFDSGLAKSVLPDYFTKTGLDVLEKPQESAEVLRAAKYAVPDEFKLQVSAAIAQATDPVQFGKAYRFLQTIEHTAGSEEYSSLFLNQGASEEYSIARGLMQGTVLTPEDAFLQLKEQRRQTEVAKKTPLSQVTGDSNEASAVATLTDKLNSAASEVYKADVKIAPDVAADLRENTKRIFLGRTNGQGDLDSVIRDVIKTSKGRLQVVPGVNGLTLQQVDSPGAIPFGPALNPETGQIEDTTKVWDKDADWLTKNLGTEFLGTERPFVTAVPSLTRNGVWAVNTAGGLPAMFAGGGTYQIGGRKVTLPKDINEAQRELAAALSYHPPAAPQANDPMTPAVSMPDDLLPPSRQSAQRGPEALTPQRLVVVPYPPDRPTGLLLGYRVGFSEGALPGINEREVLKKQGVIQ